MSAFLPMLLLCLASAFTAGAQTFSVSFDRDTITLGESAMMTMTFAGGTIKGLPSLPQIPNVRFSEALSHTSSFNIVNSQSSATEYYTFSVTPTQPGAYTIPSLNAEIGGRPAVSQPVKLTVLKPSVAAPVSENRAAFLKLIVPKTNVYVGEVLTVEIVLYFQIAKDPEAPKIKEEGFTLGRTITGQQSYTILNNQRYNIFPIKTYVVPAKVGDLPLGPATMKLSVASPNSPVDIFGRYVAWQAIELQSEPQSLHVMQLPAAGSAAPGFSGAVGNYHLTLSAAPTNVAVGDPITVTVTVTGRGAVESITLPEQKTWEQFKEYPPTSDFEAAASDPLGLTGTKTFKLTVVPQSLDIKELPPFQFSYFDPDQNRYQSLTRPAVPLIVRPSAASLPPPTLATLPSTDNSSFAGRDIAHIKPRPGALAQIQPPLIAQPWFVAMQSVPVLAWLALLVSRRQKEKLAHNPKLRRQRLVDRIVHDSLKELKLAAQSGQPEEFYAILFRALQEQLGERLDLPASAITEAVVDERLRPLQLPEEILALVSQLFQTCNQARYAQQVSAEELAATASDAEYALGELRKIGA